MSYQLEIKDDALYINGVFGKYEAEDSGKGEFVVSVVTDVCINELDSEGEEYLVDAGQAWNIPVKNLAELNGFITKCEEERLWNYILGPIFRIKPDLDNGILYIKGHTKNFAIGETEKGFYVDELQSSKSHHIVEDLMDGTHVITTNDKWWERPVEETMEIMNDLHCYAKVTDGGNLKVELKNKSFVIGNKDNGGFWVNITGGQERHVYYKDNWKDVVALLK